MGFFSLEKIINIGLLFAFIYFLISAYIFFIFLPERHKKIIDYLEKNSFGLNKEQIEFLKKLHVRDSDWKEFNKLSRKVDFQDNSYIEDLLKFVKSIKERCSKEQAKRKAIDNFKMGGK